MINITKIKVRYVETDQMGVVHHSNYYSWFEVGRTEFFNQIGMSYGEIERKGIMMPLIEGHCYYKHGAKYEDQLIIKTWLDEFRGVRAKISYQVIREADDKLLAEGNTIHTFTNLNFKPVNLKKENVEIYELLNSIMNE